MKILFIENRYVTWIWLDVAKRLECDGHEIHWIVHNRMFRPSLGTCHFFSGPNRYRSPDGNTQDNVAPSARTLSSDRQARYFNGNQRNCAQFQGVIRAILENERPDVIFGEPTQLHELITIDESRRLGIPFLYPSPTRYPKNRIQFFQYDTLASFGGTCEKLPDIDARAMRVAIVERREIPGYMRRETVSGLRLTGRHLVDKARIIAGWASGDRILTPSPVAKLRRNSAARKARDRWAGFALRSIPKNLEATSCTLYAMQLQPESSIDVWGFPWNDQAKIIGEAAGALGNVGAKLVLKLNPSAKYELDMDLCDLVQTHPSIVPLSLNTRMDEIFPLVDAVLSVTGTILIEAIMAGKPVGVLGDHEYAYLPGVKHLTTPSEITSLIDPSAKAKAATSAEAEKILKEWYGQSYDAVLYDPLNQPEWATTENLDNIVNAFRHILSLLHQTPRCRPGTRTFYCP